MGLAAAAPPQDVVTRLREKIRQLEAAPKSPLASLSTGIRRLDALLPGGGMPLGTVVELWGAAASGRTSLALRTVASATREGRLCAYVDGPRELHAAGARALGVDLERLLVVQTQSSRQLVWSAVQLLRSGAFAAVVLDLTHTGLRLSLAEDKRLMEAAGQSGALCVILTPPEAPAGGSFRLQVRPQGLQGLEVEVVRSRGGGAGAVLLSWEELLPRAPVYRLRPPEAWGALERSADAAALGSVPDLRTTEEPDPRDERNGAVGIWGQRPGRDISMPLLTATGVVLGN